ncbi:hypothetical protein LZ009_10275 [Ramlibacter sp. XY19]|uniref:hypothetical protein n=1 Tax=Ramlibacter paludis TaxID=2908000 RepID=UPI0023DC63B4|nr:hypothetical protein [Ramlibacter paludis]MCG2593167.1 hypothetical protein [Ramlibacter paludis]
MLRLLPSCCVLLGLLALAPVAHALCTSDNVPQPRAVLERFVNADCADCWQDPATPKAAPGTLALDWVLPGRKGEDAPLASVALDEALDRLYELKLPSPERTASVTLARGGPAAQLRLAQGEAFNDYIGTSMTLKQPGRERWRAWLLLVEKLPAGLEGSPVPRNLVRNVFRPEWDKVMSRPRDLVAEDRAMQIHEGSRTDRLRLVAVLADGHGAIRAITQTECSP